MSKDKFVSSIEASVSPEAQIIFDEVYNQFKDTTLGVQYYNLDVEDGNRWALVFGCLDGYSNSEDDPDYCQLCGKVAYQSTRSMLQCDYDIDWTMPYDKKTYEVDDTNIPITGPDDVQWLLDQCRRIRGVIPEVSADKKNKSKNKDKQVELTVYR